MLRKRIEWIKMKEKEVKIKLSDPCIAFKISKKLNLLGIELKEKTSEHNYILDLNNNSLKTKDCILRVREILNGQGSNLTFKGPLEESLIEGIKIREEITATIDTPKRVLNFLKSIGFEIVCKYSKERQTYELFETQIQLDHVLDLGYFVEIEGPSEQRITEIIKLCGLGKFERITKSYPDLIAERNQLQLQPSE